MIKSCLSLLAGAYALHFTSFVSNYVLLPAALFGAVFAWLAGGRRATAWFTAGFGVFMLHGVHVVDLRLPPKFEGDSMLTTVRIIDFPRTRGGSTSFLAEPVDDRRSAVVGTGVRVWRQHVGLGCETYLPTGRVLRVTATGAVVLDAEGREVAP